MIALTPAQERLLALLAAGETGATPEMLSTKASDLRGICSDFLILSEHGLVRSVQVWVVTESGRVVLAEALRMSVSPQTEEERLPTSTELLAAAEGRISGTHRYAGILQTVFMLANLPLWAHGDLVPDGTSDVGSSIVADPGVGKDVIADPVIATLIAATDQSIPQIPGIGAAVAAVASAWLFSHWSDAHPEARTTLDEACRRYDQLAHPHCPRPEYGRATS